MSSLKSIDIPVRHFASYDEFFREFVAPGRPVILDGMIEHWRARQTYSPDYFKRTFGNLEFDVAADLPKNDTPFFLPWKNHVRHMNFGAFIDHMQTTDSPCYLHRVFTKFFPDADNDFDFGDLTPPSGKCFQFMWVGSAGTNSGLHFDIENNLLAQVYGRKKVYLVAPEETANLYVFEDNLFKSKVNVANPDLDTYPNFAKVTVHEGVLNPGQVLYIPQPWWHALVSLDPSISISFVYGHEARLRHLFWVVGVSGRQHWRRAAADAFRYGLLKRGFDRRLFSEPPTGQYLYECLVKGLMRRLGARVDEAPPQTFELFNESTAATN